MIYFLKIYLICTHDFKISGVKLSFLIFISGCKSSFRFGNPAAYTMAVLCGPTLLSGLGNYSQLKFCLDFCFHYNFFLHFSMKNWKEETSKKNWKKKLLCIMYKN